MITAYFDADGIFDAATDHRFSPPPAEQTGWEDWNPITVPGAFPGYWSGDLVDAVNRIAGIPSVTCKWLTSWEEQAPLQLAPAIGLAATEWEVIYGVEEDDPMNWHWWKLAKIHEDLEKDRPEGFIWLDDDITSDPAALHWLRTIDLPHLAVCPRTADGLTRVHLDEIESFIGKQFHGPIAEPV